MKYRTLVYSKLARWLIIAVSVFVFSVGLKPGQAYAAPTISPATLSGGQVGTPYSVGFDATPCNGTCTWTYTGSLPPGLSIVGSAIYGTPTTVGAYAFTITVSDSGDGTASQSYIINITAPALTFTTTSIPDATVGQAYSASVVASGGSGTITYAMSGGNLPSGLSFNNGQLIGTPARGTAGAYSFTITATSGTVTTQQTFTLTVDKGTFTAIVSISDGLAEGQTKMYIGGALQATMNGGDTVKVTGLDPDSTVTVSVDSIVPDPGRTDIRYVAEQSSASISQDYPQVTFNYYPEYDVELKTDPAGITTISGSGWYKEGQPLAVTADDIVTQDSNSQYQFAYWLAPGGDKIKSETLNIGISQAGQYIATYDLYYKITIASQFGNVQGGGWQKAGSVMQWNVNPLEVAMPGVLGFFGGKYKTLLSTGTETVEGPKTVTVQWDADYTTPIITIPLTILIIAGLIYGIYALVRRGERAPQPIPYPSPFQAAPPPIYYPPYPIPPPPPPPQPAMPAPQTTVFMIGEGLKKPPQNTREQLMEKFGELLQKYEEELAQGKELPQSPELTEVGPVFEKKSLPAPDINVIDSMPEKASPAEECGFTTKKLLRTVVTQWKNTSIKPIVVTPGDKKSAALAGGRTVTWTRNTYNEWELHICKLPAGHKGTHKGATEIVYSVLDTINEDRNYGPKQPLKPPIPHYTDGMPEVDIPTSQIISSDQLPA